MLLPHRGMPRFIDPTTDFGFKRLFGQEESKEVMKGFLFDVLNLPAPIADLVYLPTEQVPGSSETRWGIYDVYCTDTNGQRFIVEMQRNRQVSFRERILYYMCFPIMQQVERGSENIQLLPVYCVSILSFRLDETTDYLKWVQLTDARTGKVFYEKLTLVTIELPKFTQPLSTELKRDEQWVLLLQQMQSWAEVPQELAREPLLQAFELAEYATLTSQEQWQYEQSLKHLRDEVGVLSTAREEGSMNRANQIARSMLAKNYPVAEIAELTGLTTDEILALAGDE